MKKAVAIVMIVLGGLAVITGLYLGYTLIDYVLHPFIWVGIGGAVWLTRQNRSN